MLVDFEDIFSLNVTVMSLGLDAITDTSVGGALSHSIVKSVSNSEYSPLSPNNTGGITFGYSVCRANWHYY